MISADQRYWWRIALELKLRKCSGDAFQDFFAQVMAAAHGSDFVRVRAYGAIGDKGCDGYLQSNGAVYQCYGSLGAQQSKASYLISKMDKDFATARTSLTAIMGEWHMVHNFVDGLPIPAVEKLNEIKQANESYQFGFIGLERLEELIFSLPQEKIEDLLGVVPTTLDAQNLQPTELRDLIANVAAAADDTPFDPNAIRPVPPDKLEFNRLPSAWASLIAGGWQNAHLVKTYFDRHPDPLTGERVAQIFRVRYQYLKAQNLSAGAIMTALYDFVAGKASVSPQRQVAAQALLAHLFEACDIFENKPVQATA